MGEDDLKPFLPSKGDRVAAREFCSKKLKGNEKKTLIDRLRQKFVPNSDTNRTFRGVGNGNASRTKRTVEIGWMNFCTDTLSYKQVRSPKGGGTRTVKFLKTDTASLVLEKGKSLFFPEGSSKIGRVSSFSFELCDFNLSKIDKSSSIEDLYSEFQVRTLRVYICSKKLDTSDSETPKMKAKSSKKNKKKKKLNETFSANSYEIHDEDDDQSLPDIPLSTSPVDIVEKAAQLAEIPNELNLTTQDFHYNDSAVSFDIPAHFVQEQFEDTSSINTASTETLQLSHDLQWNNSGTAKEETKSYVTMHVHRGTLAFREVLGYFKNPSIMNKFLTINRILPNGEREMAEDTGGVLRDLLSEFWTSFYDVCTLGREAKVPSLRHDFGNAEWEAVGRVLVYGYRETGYWPVMLAKSFMLQVISDEEPVTTESLLKDFFEFVSFQDMENFKHAIEDYPTVDQDDLLESLDLYECKSLTSPENIKAVILEIAHTHIIQKPMFVVNSMKQVVRELHLTNEILEDIYKRIVPTNKNVMKLFHFPDEMDPLQSEVSKHLKRYIRDLDPEKLKLFLRFCTGSNLLTMDKISVEFTVMHGIERRPIAHTCSCMLQLSKTYESFMEFRLEFDNVLSENVWVMDII